MVQRGHNFAVVDEVDSILIDEAQDAADHLRPRRRGRQVVPGDGQAGHEAAHRRRLRGRREEAHGRRPGDRGSSAPRTGWASTTSTSRSNTRLVGYLNNAIRAKELFKRDRDYVVMNGEVMIVDEHTGRMLAGRRYNEGLHQSIEAKEGVEVKAENQTLATVTLQNFFRLYKKLSGMTGTAMTEANEFNRIYGLGVVVIPTNRPMIRADLADLVYRTEDAKWNAVVERHRRAARRRPADPGRHGERGQQREAVDVPAQRGHPAPGAQREVPRQGGHDHRPGRPQGRGHGGDQHGRSRHRHHPRRERRVPGRPVAAGPGPDAQRDPRGVRGRLARRAARPPRRRSPPSTSR